MFSERLCCVVGGCDCEDAELKGGSGRAIAVPIMDYVMDIQARRFASITQFP